MEIQEIQNAVAEYFGINPQDMRSPRRAICLARPRQIAMYLSRKLTNEPLESIGARFCKHHATVMHAIETIEALSASGKRPNEHQTTNQQKGRRMTPASNDNSKSVCARFAQEILRQQRERAEQRRRAEEVEAFGRLIHGCLGEG